ncbi:MAG TPA: hypothetical protein VFM52_00910 [Rhodanobacter sp.]|nr:hypothetical protein [Rhodanobacter sp.]
MKYALAVLALAGTLAATALPAQTPATRGAKPRHAAKTTVERQRATVKQLEHDVAGQEAGSRDAARRLQQKDAEIAELQRQLRAVQPAAARSSAGH